MAPDISKVKVDRDLNLGLSAGTFCDEVMRWLFHGNSLSDLRRTCSSHFSVLIAECTRKRLSALPCDPLQRHIGIANHAVPDALLSAYKHLDQFKGQAQLSTWLTAVVTNCARMYLRRRPRQIHLSLDEQFGEEQEYSLSE
jgi:hypothetical protein